MNKDKIYMKIAYDLSELSHCVSHKVGAIIVKDGRILSTGINGTPKGCTNCDEVFNKDHFDRMTHHQFNERFEIHAETNAIIFAAKQGIPIEDSVMYSTLYPCYNCLKIICNSGIKKVYYAEDYDLATKDEMVDDLLRKCGLTIEKLNVNEAADE